MSQVLLLHPSEDVHEVLIRDGAGVVRSVHFRKCDVRVKKTKDEKRETRRIYRKKYNTLPLTIEKNLERLKNPAVQLKRKEYSQRADVKERKRINAQNARKVRMYLKLKEPDNYERILKKAVVLDMDEDEEHFESRSSPSGDCGCL